jgi:hypothetical protein
MSSTTGLTAQGVYNGADAAAILDQLKALIPNPDASIASGTGAIQGGVGGYLDQMSPGAASQLRVEIDAVKAAIAALE